MYIYSTEDQEESLGRVRATRWNFVKDGSNMGRDQLITHIHRHAVSLFDFSLRYYSCQFIPILRPFTVYLYLWLSEYTDILYMRA